MTMIARHLIITGRVQGVYYRGWTVEAARSLGLVGWVRNRRDGSVEAMIQGDAANVQRLVELARRGPGAARVDAISETTAEIENLPDFQQRPTV